MILRANPYYSLVPLSALNAAERAVVSDFAEKRTLFGVLRPALASGLRTKAIDTATAALFLQLQSFPNREMPRESLMGRDLLIALMMDRVIEISAGTTFVSGAAGLSSLGQRFNSVDPVSPTARLSRAALKYAQALKLNDLPALSRRLYAYNRLPLSPVSRSRLRTDTSVDTLLNCERGSSTLRLLNKEWHKARASNRVWTHYTSAGLTSTQSRSIKLYISPLPSNCAYVFGLCLRLFTEMGVPAFKVVDKAVGLLRPDKFIAYFSEIGQKNAVADCLATALAGVPAHGVPFTATCGSTGLLSWGIDPPRPKHTTSSHPMSWRSWITVRLASAMLDSQSTPSDDCEQWQFAEQRLRLAGVETTTWEPSESNWVLD